MAGVVAGVATVGVAVVEAVRKLPASSAVRPRMGPSMVVAG